jgi:hypothetical protein
MESIIVRLEEFKLFELPKEQESGDIRIARIQGYISASTFVQLFDFFVQNFKSLGLDSNPREPKESRVTQAIFGTLENSPSWFHFMSKGILLSSSQCEILERNRIRLHFNQEDEKVDGILDGGHNTFAIAKFILNEVLNQDLRKVKTLQNLAELWSDSREAVHSYLKQAEEKSTLTFLVPVDIVYPSSIEDEGVEKKCSEARWSEARYNIASARNNNAQLKESTIDNYQGYYKLLKEVLPKEIESKIIWRTNDTNEGQRSIPVEDIVALSLIPLSKLENADTGSLVKIYNGKGSCIQTYKKIYDKFKEDNQLDLFKSYIALLPEYLYAYDHLYENFPDAYNSTGGKFGKMRAVNNDKTNYTKFTERKCNIKYPDGFIYPLLVSLKELIVVNPETNKVEVQDLTIYLKKRLKTLMVTHKSYMEAYQFFPEKVGRASGAYDTLSTIVRLDSKN